MRLFIAVELDNTTQDRLAQVSRPLQVRLPEGSIRWVRPEGRHLTLKFLGEVPRDGVSEIRAALRNAAAPFPKFSIRIGGFGVFPNLRRPRVLWVGVEDPSGRLAEVQAAVEAAMTELGFDPERRRFHPHVTLGRVGRRVRGQLLRSLADELEELELGEVGRMKVDRVVLIRSELKPTGAEYTQIEAAPLEGESRAS
jgi:2'-5' RNA ligase